MPETKDIQNEPDLDSSVGDLLSELEAEASRQADSPAPTPDAIQLPPGGSRDAAGETRASRGGSALEEPALEEPVSEGLVSNEPVSEEPASEEPVAEELAPEVPAPEAPGPSASPKGASEQPFGNQQTIQSLDDELAGIADDLLVHEQDEDPPGRPANFMPAMPAVAALRPEVYRPKPLTEEKARDTPPTVDVAPSPSPMRERSDLWRRIRAAVETYLYNLLAAISSPLNGRPGSVRTGVGAAALFNLFLAMCVWGYTLFLMPKEAPPPRPVAASAAAKAPEALKGSAKGKSSEPAKKSAKGGH